jgi:hypothetical protein
MVFNYILVKNPKMAQFCRSIFQHHWTMVRIWASHERYFAVWLQTFATPLNGRSAIRHGRCQVAMTWAVTGVAMGWNGLPYVAMGRFSAFEKSGVGKMRKNMRSFAEIQWISMNQWSIYQWCVFNLDHLFPPICQFFFPPFVTWGPTSRPVSHRVSHRASVFFGDRLMAVIPDSLPQHWSTPVSHLRSLSKWCRQWWNGHGMMEIHGNSWSRKVWPSFVSLVAFFKACNDYDYIWQVPSGNLTNITMENHHFSWKMSL